MSENLARCRRCHDVFDPELGLCPRCGTPWQPIAAPPPIEEGSFQERYAGTTLTEAAFEPPTVVPHGNKNTTMALMAAGGGLIAVAIVVAILFGGGLLVPSGNAPIIVSVAPATSAAPTPTPRPETAMALKSLNDPNLNAHVLIQNRIDEDSVITGHPYSSVITWDCAVSNGNLSGTLTAGSKAEEIRFVDGKYFVRQIPGTKWTASAAVSSWINVLPLFDIKTARMIDFVGTEERDGQQTDHFRTTNRWVADINRLGLVDAAVLGIKPDKATLDLWTTSFGEPVFASFSGTTLTTDGRKLLDIETTFTFTDVGTPVAVINPLATPAPSVRATATPGS